MAKTKGQYPAPLAALRAIRDGLQPAARRGPEGRAGGGARGDRDSPISANLIGVFFMTNRLARDPGVDRPDVDAPDGPSRRRARVRADGGGDRHGARPVGHPDGDGRRRRRPPRRRDEARARRSIAGRIKIGRATPQDMADMLAHAQHVDLARPASPTATWSSRPSPRTRRPRRRSTGSWRRSCATTRSWPATPRRSRSRGWPSRPPTRRGSSACTSSTRSTGWSWSRSSAARRQRRDGGDDRRPGQAHPQDADRRPRLPGLPGQPRAASRT